MYFDYNFKYLTDLGERVVIHVSYLYESPDPYSLESDWDYYGGIFIDKVEVEDNEGQPFKGEISEQEIQRELLHYLKNANYNYEREI